jgi:hypothetical protein
MIFEPGKQEISKACKVGHIISRCDGRWLTLKLHPLLPSFIVNVRRRFVFLKLSIDYGAQGVVYAPER